jgi:hypothetical protein
VHLSTIVALATRVSKHLERRLLVLLKEHSQLPLGDPEVVLVECVRDVPAHRAIKGSLLHEAVEKREGEQHVVELVRFGAVVPKPLFVDRVALIDPLQTCAKTLRTTRRDGREKVGPYFSSPTATKEGAKR